MKFTWVLSAFLTVTGFLLSSCGDEEIGGERSDREFSQDVRLINYRLKNVEIDATVDSNDGSREVITKRIGFAVDESKDKIQRKIENDKYILVVNDKTAGLSLSSSGKTESSQTTNAQKKTCELSGKSTISGNAENTQLQLVWQLDLSLAGSNCEAEMRTKFHEFITKESDSINLQSVRDVLAASDLKKEKMNRIILRMKLTAEGF